MTQAIFVEAEHVCPIGIYPSPDGKRALWSIPLATDAGDLTFPHLLRASDDSVFFRYCVVATPGGEHAVVYTGPRQLPPSILDAALPEMVRVALEEAPLFRELTRARSHL